MGYVLINKGENIKTGDQQPKLVLRLRQKNDNPEDLSSVDTVSLYIGEPSSDELTVDDDTTGNVSVSNDINGEVTYEWQSGDTDRAGTYIGEVEVTFTSGETKTFPSRGTFTIYINEGLN